jgi:hypothetical protein
LNFIIFVFDFGDFEDIELPRNSQNFFASLTSIFCNAPSHRIKKGIQSTAYLCGFECCQSQQQMFHRLILGKLFRIRRKKERNKKQKREEGA